MDVSILPVFPTFTEVLANSAAACDYRVATAPLEGHFPILGAYAKPNAKGDYLPKFWQVVILQSVYDPAVYATASMSFQLTTKGTLSKATMSVPVVANPVNVGKANETTALEQAVAEARGDWNRKHDREGYRIMDEMILPYEEDLIRPMLAHPFKEAKHMKKEVWVQPKLDGIRYLTDGARFWSRKANLAVDGVMDHLRMEVPEGIVIDGEIMLDQNLFTFQETVRAIKKFREDVTPHLQYHVYDLFNRNNRHMPFTERYALLTQIVQASGVANVFLVETRAAFQTSHVQDWHDDWVQERYEGAIVRNPEGAYLVDNRSHDLTKFKKFDDEEFTVLSYTAGSGADAGAVMFIASSHHHPEHRAYTHDEVQAMSLAEFRKSSLFTFRPRGPLEKRQVAYKEADRFIGLPYTVKYFGLSEDGIPRFPVGKDIRNYE